MTPNHRNTDPNTKEVVELSAKLSFCRPVHLLKCEQIWYDHQLSKLPVPFSK